MIRVSTCPNCAQLSQALEIARQDYRVELLGYFEIAREVRDKAINQRDTALARVAELEASRKKDPDA